MTKQQIFSLYLANENQKVLFKCDSDTAWKNYGIDTPINDTLKPVAIWVGKDGGQITFLDDEENSYMLSDCQLVLKPIAEMSEEHKNEYVQLRTGHYSSNGVWFWHKDNLDCILFLITHGYALDDTYFINGIAIKESK